VLVAHALPALLDGTLVPFACFYALLLASGLRSAVLAGLGWCWFGVVARLVRRQRLPGMLVLSTLVLTARSVATLLTGSAFVYFAQPTVATALLALAFLVSACWRRTLAERLAHDFCPLDADLLARPFVRRFFLRVSLLWAVVLLANATMVMWLLLRSSLGAFVLERAAVSAVLTVGGIALSVLWFARALKAEGVAIRVGARTLLDGTNS
jgi:hypothetical protein